MIIEGLESCEAYLIGVGLNGPLGPGPITIYPNLVMTQYDKKAAPKNLMVTANVTEPRLVHITWSASCSSVKSPVGYEVY